MASENPVLVKSHAAASDLSTHQFKAVRLNGSAALALTTAGQVALGILQNDPTSGASGDVMQVGQSRAIASAAIAEMAQVTTAASGKLVTASAGDPIVGIAKTAASGDNAIFTVLLAVGGGSGTIAAVNPPRRAALTAGAEAANVIKVAAQIRNALTDAAVASAVRCVVTSYDAGATLTDGGAGTVDFGTGTVEVIATSDGTGLLEIDVTDVAAETVIIEVRPENGLTTFISLVFA